MTKLERIVNNHVSHYNDKKYWKMKFKLNNDNVPKLIKYIYLYKMKKMESYNCASLGNKISGGSYFKEKPFFPHGIKGVFITDHAKIGKNVTILQQVTIGLKNLDDKNGPDIGDNVFIGAGAKIIGNIKIGNNVKIGANCVVVDDVPDNSTVVLQKSRCIVKKDG